MLPFSMKPTPPNIFISLTPSTPARQARTRAARSSSPLIGTALSTTRDERLSWLSSDLPWLTVSENGVEDGQELSRDGDESDHFGFAGGDEAIEEGLQGGVVAFGDHGAHEQGGAHGDAPSADEAA